jgi:hypothetical protein
MTDAPDYESIVRKLCAWASEAVEPDVGASGSRPWKDEYREGRYDGYRDGAWTALKIINGFEADE